MIEDERVACRLQSHHGSGERRRLRMAATWDHPRLGRFTCRFDEWEGEVEAAGFDAFTWRRDEDDPPGRYELRFDADDPGDVPSDAAVAVAVRVHTNHEALAREVARALWAEFDGRGPESSIWGHYGTDQLAAAFADNRLPPPAEPDDLRRGLKLLWVAVRKGVDGYPRPVAELAFAAAFDEEHGLGVLTDGEKVIGTGFHGDVAPYAAE
jgi:hypothetical protein